MIQLNNILLLNLCLGIQLNETMISLYEISYMSYIYQHIHRNSDFTYNANKVVNISCISMK